MVFLTSICMKFIPPWLRIKPKKDAYLYKDSLYRLTQYFNHRNRNCWRIARTYWEKTQQRNMKLRKEQRRNFIDLYSQRVLAALSEHEFSYRDFMRAAANCGIQLSKKSLSSLAIYEPRTFKCIVDVVKTQWCEEGHTEKARYAKPPEGVFTRGMLQDFKPEQN